MITLPGRYLSVVWGNCSNSKFASYEQLGNDGKQWESTFRSSCKFWRKVLSSDSIYRSPILRISSRTGAMNAMFLFPLILNKLQTCGYDVVLHLIFFLQFLILGYSGRFNFLGSLIVLH